MSDITINIPVTGAVKKYILYRFRYHTRLEVTKNNSIGHILFHLLSDSKKLRTQGGRPVAGSLVFHIGQWNAFKGCGVWLNEKGVKEFTNAIKDRIKEDFLDFMDERKPDITVVQAIRDFKQKYDFEEEDLTSDSLIKIYQRYNYSSKSVA